MSIRVRMFAALREAAGTGETTIDPGPVPALLDELCARYGEPFATRLGSASVLVDGSAVSRTAAVDVPDSAELALLPPVSGGSEAVGTLDSAPMAKAAVSGVAVCAFVAALFVGPAAFTVAVFAYAVVAMVDLRTFLARSSTPPVLPAAALIGLGLPGLAALDASRAWDRIPAVAMAGVALAFLLLLVFGRRRGAVQAMGATLLCGMAVGLGAAGLLLLRALPDGVWWVLGVLAAVAAAEVVPAALLERGRSERGAPGLRARIVPAVAAAAVVAVVLAVVLSEPWTATAAITVAAVAAAAGLAAARFRAEIRAQGWQAMVLDVGGAVLLAAPVVYAYARTVGTA